MVFIISFQINEENLQFMQHRDVYCHDYFNFIRSLSFVNNVSITTVVHKPARTSTDVNTYPVASCDG